MSSSTHLGRYLDRALMGVSPAEGNGVIVVPRQGGASPLHVQKLCTGWVWCVDANRFAGTHRPVRLLTRKLDGIVT